MERFNLVSKFSPSADQEKVVKEIVMNFKKHEKQTLLGVTGSGKTFVMANVINELNKPSLIISHNKTLAAQLYEEFKEFFPENAVRYFVSYYDYYQPEAYVPAKDLYIEKESEVNKQIENLRFAAMNSALTRRDTIVIASVSCIYNIGQPENYENKALSFYIGQTVELSQIALELVSMRYERDTYDFVNGVFRITGDIIDIFPPYEDVSIRVELFGKKVERISKVDPISKRKITQNQFEFLKF